MPPTHTRRRPALAKLWLAAWLAVAAGLLGRSLATNEPAPRRVASAAPAGVADATARPAFAVRRTLKAIEELRVGDRVLADNPEEASSERTAVDPSTWRLLTLYAEETWPDGTLDTIHIQTLQPPGWVELFGAEVGAEVPPPLDLVEMGLSEELVAKVIKNQPCPPLQPPLTGGDPGRLVLTTVDHLNTDVWELEAEPIRGPPGAATTAGEPQTLKPTGFHKFYSETRSAWVSTNELEPGEVIRGRAGPLRVTRAWPLPGVERVYNLTVEGEHVYYVGEMGLLAHNQCPKVNAVQGALGEDAVRERLVNSRVFDLVGEQIRINTPQSGSYRVTDFLVRSKRSGKLAILEVKTGNAARSTSQFAKDAEIAKANAETLFYGRNARAAGFANNSLTGPIRTFEITADNIRALR